MPGRAEHDPVVVAPDFAPPAGLRSKRDEDAVAGPHDRLGSVSLEHVVPPGAAVEQDEIVLDERCVVQLEAVVDPGRPGIAVPDVEIVADEVLMDDARLAGGQAEVLLHRGDRVLGITVDVDVRSLDRDDRDGDEHERDGHTAEPDGVARAPGGQPADRGETVGQDGQEHDARQRDVAPPHQGRGDEHHGRECVAPAAATGQRPDRAEHEDEERTGPEAVEGGRLPLDDVRQHVLAAQEVEREQQHRRAVGVDDATHEQSDTRMGEGLELDADVVAVERAAQAAGGEVDERERPAPVDVDPQGPHHEEPPGPPGPFDDQDHHREQDERDEEGAFRPAHMAHHQERHHDGAPGQQRRRRRREPPCHGGEQGRQHGSEDPETVETGEVIDQGVHERRQPRLNDDPVAAGGPGEDVAADDSVVEHLPAGGQMGQEAVVGDAAGAEPEPDEGHRQAHEHTEVESAGRCGRAVAFDLTAGRCVERLGDGHGCTRADRGELRSCS